MKNLLSKLTSLIPLITLFSIIPHSIFAADVVINEFQIEPSNTQWVELYNKGEQAVDISNWIIDDSGGSEKYTIDNGISLLPEKCISFQSGKFNFNTTSSDSARLIVNNGIIDSYSYSKSPGENVSFARSVDGSDSWVTFNNPSRDKLNSTGEVCLMPTFTPTPLPTSTSAPTKKPTNTPHPSATSKPQNPSPLTTKTLSDTKVAAVTLFTKQTDNSKSSTSGEIQEEKVLGLDISGMDSNAEEGIDSTSSSKQSKPLVLLLGLIGGGFACIFGAVILSIKKIRSRHAV